MYIEADMLYSYIKPTDWLKKYAETAINNETDLKTSLITIIEIEFIAKRDFDDDFANLVLEKLEKIKNLKFIPLDINIVKKAVEFRKKYKLNIFDSLHASTAFIINENIISTDHIYDSIEEIKRTNPMEFSDKLK